MGMSWRYGRTSDARFGAMVYAGGRAAKVDWKSKLLDSVRTLDGLEARPSPVSGGTALFFRGQEFAHFHTDNEIDLRLTKNVIRALGLVHPPDSMHHPGRSPNSPWIELRYHDAAGVGRVAELIRRAAKAT